MSEVATTTAPAPAPDPAPLRSAVRRWRWPVVVAVALVLAVLASLAASRPASRIPLSPDNPGPAGARAVAEILRREGVRIEVRRTTAGVLDVTPPDATILVTSPHLLVPDQWQRLRSTGADLVLTDVAFTDLAAVTDAVRATAEGADGTRTADCADPDALAAGTIVTGSGDVRATAPGAVVVCFPSGPDTGAYAVVDDGGRRIAILANSRPLTNAELAEAGNAALVLRVLGRSERLTWYLPISEARTATAVPPLLPPAVPPVLGLGFLVFAVAAVARGRRFGRLVAEPLPVVVPPAETIRGRARLYRRARAYGHAAEALRAGTAARIGRRLGVPEGAGAPALLAAVARSGGPVDRDVGAVLYGPDPDDDAALVALAAALDRLEREVTR